MVNTDKTIREIKAALSNPEHTKLAEKILSETTCWLSNEIYEAEIDYTASLLGAAKLEMPELNKIITGHDNDFNKFCIHYIKALPSLNQGQEYNPIEQEDENEQPNEEYSGHSQTFIIQYAVLYFVLRHKSAELLPYLKKIREPHASRQATLLKNFFSDFSSKTRP